MEGSEQSQQLIRHLLEYARAGTHGMSFKMTNFEWVLKQALTTLKLSILDSGADISHDSLPQVMADRFQMVQLFQNLLSNAIKYKSDAPLKIHVGVKQCNNGWVFSVRDNGIGIDPKYKDRIFALFQRLHTKPEHTGSGIGLAICKKIVERHGGTIWMESQPNKGAVFYFSLSNTPSPSNLAPSEAGSTEPHG